MVNEFHKAGGLSQLVALGKEDEAQLQNFILRYSGLLLVLVVISKMLILVILMVLATL